MNTIASSDGKELAPVKEESISRIFVLQNHFGLHCRAAALLVKTLRNFACDARVEANGAVANGKSIIGLLALAAGNGSKLKFVLTGSDAESAMEALGYLFGNNLAQAYSQERLPDNAHAPGGSNHECSINQNRIERQICSV